MRMVAGTLGMALLLAGCGSGDGTSVSINAQGSDGNSTSIVSNGATGSVSIKGAGFAGSIRLPKLKFSGDNFSLNGVKLYPGSTVDTMNIDAKDLPGDKDQGRVKIAFHSPAPPAKVRDWFMQRLPKAGYKVQATDNVISGKNDDDNDFRMTLTDRDGNTTGGTIDISGD